MMRRAFSRAFSRAFTTASRVLQEATTISPEHLNVLERIFVKNSNIFSIMAGVLTLGTGLNQYLVSVQLDNKFEKMDNKLERQTVEIDQRFNSMGKQIDQRFNSMDNKLEKIEKLLGHAKV